MKVLERTGAAAGDYKTAYLGLINPGNKVGLRDTKGGKRLMFKLKSIEEGKKDEIAASILWKPDDERTIAALGAVGVPADQLFKIAEAKGDNTAILWFDKKAKEAAEYGILINAYVREEGGFASGLRPIEGKFTVKFLRIKTRKDADEEHGKSGTPYWIYVPSKPTKGRGGKSYPSDPMNRFWTQFVVVEGKRRGAIIEKMYHYAIVRNEDDEWVLDGESSNRGAEFKKLLTLHDYPASKIDPDKNFKDPENGLPEIERFLIKAARPLGLELSNGWAGELTPPEGAASIDTAALDVGGDEGQMPRLVTMLERRVQLSVSKSAWLSDGRISKSGIEWVRKHLPVTLRKHHIDPHLTGLKSEDIELLIDVLKKKYPISKKT